MPALACCVDAAVPSPPAYALALDSSLPAPAEDSSFLSSSVGVPQPTTPTIFTPTSTSAAPSSPPLAQSFSNMPSLVATSPCCLTAATGNNGYYYCNDDAFGVESADVESDQWTAAYCGQIRINSPKLFGGISPKLKLKF